MNIRKISLSEINIQIIVSDETISPFEQLSECMNHLDIQDLLDEAETSNIWKWCFVEVKGSYKGMEVSDYLGCCSYVSEEDFINNSGYYNDMCETVLDAIQEQANDLIQDLIIN